MDIEAIRALLKEATREIKDDITGMRGEVQMVAEEVRKMNEEIGTLKEAVNSIGDRVTALAAVAEDHQKRLKVLEEAHGRDENETGKTAELMHTLEEKIDSLENQERRQNLVIQGISETQGVETWEMTETKLIKVLTDNNIRITKEMLHRAHRLNSSSFPRPIIAKFVNFHDKDEILRASRAALKGTGIIVREDFSARVRHQRHALSPLQKEAYNKGLRTFYKRNKLVVEGVEFSWNPTTSITTGGNNNERVQTMTDMFRIVEKEGWRKRKASRSPRTESTRDFTRPRHNEGPRAQDGQGTTG